MPPFGPLYGQTVYVDAGGNACDIVPGTPTNPPSVKLQLTTNCASGAAAGDAANVGVFTWGGGLVASGSGTCQGMSQKVPLIPCNQLTPAQYTNIGPYLENQVPLTATGTVSGYTERGDGTGIVATQPNLGGVIASGGFTLSTSAITSLNGRGILSSCFGCVGLWSIFFLIRQFLG
jgi:hypothetical protein